MGLGAGTMAAYGRPGDTIRFYEINPEIKRLAETRFTYLINKDGNEGRQRSYYSCDSLDAFSMHYSVYSPRDCQNAYDESKNHSQSLVYNIRANHI